MAVSRRWAITKNNYYADFVIVPTIIAISILIAGFSLPYFLLGIAIWSLAEYFIHRFLLHVRYRNDHWLHHMDEMGFVGISTVKTTAIILFVFVVSLLLSATVIFNGIAFGYLLYLIVHDAIHHNNLLTNYIPNLKRSHLRHHEVGDEKNFGVITLFWDRVFGTYK